MKRRIFITGYLDQNLKAQLITAGFWITEQPMIRTEKVFYDPTIPSCDWIFFSSRNAVQYFFEPQPEIKGRKLAASGMATKKVLEKFGEVQFTGHTNDMDLVGDAFARMTSGQRVLFPQAAQSLRTIQKHLNPDLVIDLICYKTLPASEKTDSHDMYIFTSPSNVNAFFETNELESDKSILAYGQSTAKALDLKGVEQIIIPDSLETKVLLNTILLHSRS